MMKNFVKFGMTAVALMLISTFAFAQPRGEGGGGTPQERAERQTERLKKVLTLDEKQTKKVKEINLKYAEKFEKMRAEVKEEEGDRAAMRDKVMELRKEQEAAIKAVLSPEQAKKFEEMPKPGDRRGAKPGDPKGKGKKNKKEDKNKKEKDGSEDDNR